MIGDAPADGIETIELRDLTGHVGTALSTDEASWVITPDGATVYVAWSIVERGGSDRLGIIAIDTASGRRVELLSDPDIEYLMPAVSPDGKHLAFVAATRSTASEPADVHLGIVALGDDGMSASNLQLLAADWDRWPGQPEWLPDGSALIVVADSDGSAPLFRVDLDGTVTRLTADRGTYSERLRRPTTAGGSTRCGRRSTPHPRRCASRLLVPSSNRRCCAVPPLRCRSQAP